MPMRRLLPLIVLALLSTPAFAGRHKEKAPPPPPPPSAEPAPPAEPPADAGSWEIDESTLALLGQIAHSSEATAYNDRLIGLQNRVATAVEAFSSAFPCDDREACRSTHQALVATCEATLAEARATEPFQGDAAMRDALVALMEFYLDTSRNELAEILRMFTGDQPLDAVRAQEISERMSSREVPLDAALTATQTAFAQKYGFGLQ
jgi:hypothetical protein